MKIKRRNTFCVKRYVFTLLLSLFTLVNVWAQRREISGVVKEPSGQGAIAATVQVKGTTIGTVTDNNGNYTISVPADAKVLVIKYYGMHDEEVPIRGNRIDVVLREDTKVLEDVVVVGYGTSNRRDLTGPIASVDAKKLQDIPVASAAEAMAGKLAGVQVTTTEGSPDADIKIRVRGGGSITGDNSPLYIVDGFPVNSIADIPPANIKSIDVLKDASSTAIYGARGANGVIIVTTNDAKDGKISVSYNGSYGFKRIAKTLPVLNSYDFAKWQYELATLQNKVDDQYTPFFGVYDDMDIYKNIKASNWQNDIYGNTGTTFINSLFVSGGSDIVNFNLNYTRNDDKAIMYGSNYSRDNINFKMNAKPLKWLRMNFNARYSDRRVTGAGANDQNALEKSTQDSRLKHTVIYAPISVVDLTAIYTDDDELLQTGSLYPPRKSVDDNYKYRSTQNTNLNGYVQVELIKNMLLRSEIGLDNTQDETDQYAGLTTYYTRQQAVVKNDASGNPTVAAFITQRSAQRFRNTNTLTYSFKNQLRKTNHSLDFLLGHEMISTKNRTQSIVTEGLPSTFTPQEIFAFTALGLRTVYDNNYLADDNMLSFFFRATYDYKKKYLLNAIFRADGSSKFATGKQWGYFPSIAGAWRISDEDFLVDARDWLSQIKLRLSYGASGNNNIASSQYSVVYSSNTGTNVDSYYTTGNTLYNPDLKWETTITRNAGVDFGFFRNRINGSVDLYSNNTQDLLIQFPIAGTGYQSQYRNIGSTSNKGVEIVLNGVFVDTKNYGFDISYNMSFNKGRVESLGGLAELTSSSGWTSSIAEDYKVYVGQPVGLMYGYRNLGRYAADDFIYQNGKWIMNATKYSAINDKGVRYNPITEETFVDNSANTGAAWGPGAMKLKDLNEDGVITADDREVIGNATPLFTGGLNLSGRVKGFDISANFTFTVGNQIYNANKIEFTSNDNNYKYRNMITTMSSENRWNAIDAEGNIVTDTDVLAQMNATTTLWTPISKFLLTDWAVEDGSFLRLANVTFGYTFPKKVLKKIAVQQLRLYATVTNLFCLTNYSGYDPEVDTRRKSPLTPGVDYSAYPKSVGYNFGINLTF
jgi:TonB-linked SusC/RagA family outer membrane protein